MSQLRKKVKELEISAKKRRKADFDPEDEPFAKQPTSDDNTDSDASEDENLGKEHYQAVGASKLRQPQRTKLDEKKYGGRAVSRDQIFRDDGDADVLAPEDDDDEDPFAAPRDQDEESEQDEEISGQEDILNVDDMDDAVDSDDEIDSDEAFEDGEEYKLRGKGFVFRGSGRNLTSLPDGSGDDGSEVSIDSQSDVEMEGIDSNDDEDEEDDMDGSEDDPEIQDSDADEDGEDDEDEDDTAAFPRPSTIKPTANSNRDNLKALLSNETARLASSLSASLSADAKKGAAVKRQYQTFDRLLDARIKFQKGLTASNDLPSRDSLTQDEIQSALQKAEEAALKLYSTIESLRHSIQEVNSANSQDSRKRKRPAPPTISTTTSELWTRISTLETQTLPIRRQVLDKWSTKTQTTAPITSTASNLNSNHDQTQTQSKLTTVLDTYLSTEYSKLSTQSNYEDNTFYQSLLRDLINSRAATATSTLPAVPLKLHPSGNTNKARKVDVKASKGRKIRYTVHEKLENFMASEGRGNGVGQWNEGAVTEFFGSLLGQRGLLGEDIDDVDADDEGREQEALRLFRT